MRGKGRTFVFTFPVRLSLHDRMRDARKKGERRDGTLACFDELGDAFRRTIHARWHPVYCFSFFFPFLNNDGRNKRRFLWTISIVARANPRRCQLVISIVDDMATFIRRARFPVRRRYSEFSFFFYLSAPLSRRSTEVTLSCRKSYARARQSGIPSN